MGSIGIGKPHTSPARPELLLPSHHAVGNPLVLG